MAEYKRKQGSNQYSEKLEKVNPAERRLPRKRKRAMKRSSVAMATPGKPFQCPGCRTVHSTGFVCEVCSPGAQVGTMTCPGCNAAVIPAGELVCENCTLAAGRYPPPRQPVGAGVGAYGPPVAGGMAPPMAPPNGPPASAPQGWRAPDAGGRPGGSRPMPRRN